MDRNTLGWEGSLFLNHSSKSRLRKGLLLDLSDDPCRTRSRMCCVLLLIGMLIFRFTTLELSYSAQKFGSNLMFSWKITPPSQTSALTFKGSRITETFTTLGSYAVEITATTQSGEKVTISLNTFGVHRYFGLNALRFRFWTDWDVHHHSSLRLRSEGVEDPDRRRPRELPRCHVQSKDTKEGREPILSITTLFEKLMLIRSNSIFFFKKMSRNK